MWQLPQSSAFRLPDRECEDASSKWYFQSYFQKRVRSKVGNVLSAFSGKHTTAWVQIGVSLWDPPVLIKKTVHIHHCFYRMNQATQKGASGRAAHGLRSSVTK